MLRGFWCVSFPGSGNRTWNDGRRSTASSRSFDASTAPTCVANASFDGSITSTWRRRRSVRKHTKKAREFLQLDLFGRTVFIPNRGRRYDVWRCSGSSLAGHCGCVLSISFSNTVRFRQDTKTTRKKQVHQGTPWPSQTLYADQLGSFKGSMYVNFQDHDPVLVRIQPLEFGAGASGGFHMPVPSVRP